jgi:xanthine dehydrogenase accessory factor
LSTTVTAIEAARRALAAQLGGEPVVTVIVIGAPLSDAVGRRLLVSTGAAEGSLGSPDADERATGLAREALASGERRTHEIELQGGAWQLYVEPQSPVPYLLIVGAGHIARPLCRLGALLGFRVTVADDRPEYANRAGFPEAAHIQLIDFADPFRAIDITSDSYIVLVTRGHKYDYDCIQQLLESDVQPAYLGMIGSRRRVRAAFEALLAEGADPQRLRQVHAPIGLDIGSETPEEIALAIAAEIVAVRRGGRGGKLSEEELVLDRITRQDPNRRAGGRSWGEA